MGGSFLAAGRDARMVIAQASVLYNRQLRPSWPAWGEEK